MKARSPGEDAESTFPVDRQNAQEQDRIRLLRPRPAGACPAERLASPFSDYSPGDPFVVAEFSEKLRVLVEREFGAQEALFPQPGDSRRNSATCSRECVPRFRSQDRQVSPQKRLVLGPEYCPLPFMAWSAGQREFVPLLLGLYWLMPPTKTRGEEDSNGWSWRKLEMGRHPRAIDVLMLMTLELVVRGYRVCLSTHSPQVLEVLWALRTPE